jgi:DNA polymerase-3 subunit epsilon
MSLDFVAIDFETANGNRASACSVGIVKVLKGEVVETYHTYITPPSDISEFKQRNIDVHGITPSQVVGAPTFMEAWAEIVRISGDLPFIAHNAAFDMSVISKNFEREELILPSYEYLCTLKLARKAYPDLDHHTLAYLATYTGIGYDPNQHHDALYDAELAAQLFIKLAEKTNSQIFYTVSRRLGVPVSIVF